MSICQLLGIEYPIFQGAMARIATHKIAGPVSEAGGLGIIGGGGMSGDELREEIRLIREFTNKPFGVNLMLQMPNCDELVDVIIEEKVPVVTTGAGSPARYIPALKEAGVKIIPVVASVRHAVKMESLGVDAVVAEGQEAGGHIGSTSTMALLPQVVDAVKIPVLGAGGVGDGRSVAAMYALGAQGIQVGTLFLMAEECPIPASYQQRIIDANDTATIVTGRKAKDPVRSLSNTMLRKYAELEEANAPHEELEKLTVGSLSRAVYDGDMETGSAMAGEIAGLLKEVLPAKVIIERLFSEAEVVAKQLTIKY
ncbi:nitronate monooxygenase [Streptococcus uberis]|uniref:nitronate monooxygenase n=1 Tax=Streptococcus uberis TaxID=1349 RepID=UPI001FF5954C|nr:nitronate monooxygenase [Streptococcus uberis]MCK1166243.1 nitronate monooxygenase [Streptococcus uberis]MCK1195553.1 nitronate monooxygenase [Streptococcus uberis]MCK1204307.1 nitronate monooxygenase [Streptococcus uberis]MCK1232155.1 nitronate monooxygenase [Streptococcus uberis]MCK1233746.1 nitronate monooxygenase [Streptococcus uberis]